MLPQKARIAGKVPVHIVLSRHSPTGPPKFLHRFPIGVFALSSPLLCELLVEAFLCVEDTAAAGMVAVGFSAHLKRYDMLKRG